MALLTLDVIEDFPTLLKLVPEWADFAGKIEGLTPFQLPVWLVAWWKHFGSGELRCFVFRRADQMVGLVPCFLHEWNGTRQITFLGAGISDYLEPVIQPEYTDEMVDKVRRYLQLSSDWEVCDWQDLTFDTPWRALASEVTEDAPCMQVPLQGSFETYWESCGQGLRQNVRRDRRKAESRGNLEFHVSEGSDPELMDGLIEMHRERWKKKNESGMIEANRSAEFLREIAHEFAAQGLLRIFSLRFEEKLIAVILAFAYQSRMSNYLTGFDPAYERLGFGRTLLYEALRYCFENQYKTWDFLRGDEPYKRLWRAQVIPKIRVVVNRKA